MPARRDEWMERALAKWALALADEIEDMLGRLRASMSKGALQDALDELYRVLLLASEDELAEEVIRLKELADRAATQSSVVSGFYFQAVSLQSLREKIMGVLWRVRRKMKG